MVRLLIVAATDLTDELGETVLWRQGIDRVYAPNHEAGLESARRLAPRIVVVDARDSMATQDFIECLRAEPETRSCSVVALSRSPTLSDESALFRAGANVVLAGHAEPSHWDSRFETLLSVPRRRDARIPVVFETWAVWGPESARIEGRLVNLSVRGLLLETTAALDVGARLDLCFALGEGQPDLRVVGQVVREAGTQEGRIRYGIEFLIFREDARERVDAFVAAESRR